jgi:type IV secretory pathway TraG/TraD family ATPase VirD4
LVEVTGWDAARSVAARLALPARPQAGATPGGDHWTDRAESWLSVLLFAAKLASPGGDLDSLARWSMAPTTAGPEVEALLIVAAEDGTEGASIAAAVLDSLLSAPDKERESIASTLARLLNIYTSPAALSAGRNPNFEPTKFVRSQGDSVFIASPVDRQKDFAPLIAGLLESIRLAQYRRRQAVDLGRETQSAPVTFVLDEAANTAPIPLPNIVSEAGGQGLHLVVALQDMSQARARWGDSAAEGFLTMFPDKLILAGMNDRATAEMMSKASGEFDRMTVAVSTVADRTRFGAARQHEHTRSYSSSRAPVLSVADITGVPAGQGLHWNPGGWQLLTLTPWWQLRTRYRL